jgi:hypothetical protein
MVTNKQNAYGERLIELVEASKLELLELGEPGVSLSPSPGSWSAKQVLGHLFDSATNNHQRFVRAIGSGGLEFPGYDQDRWVAANRYQDAVWVELVQLWAQFNRFLAQVIGHLPAAELGTWCTIGDGEAVTLEFLIEDYIRHTQHHLGQIREVGRT